MSHLGGGKTKPLKYDRLIKVISIGDRRVGKSSLVQRFYDDSFTSPVKINTGVDFWTKNVRCRETIVTLQLWDTTGLPGRDTPTSIYRGPYYRGAKGILLVYDVSDEVSFVNVRNWMKLIHESAPTDVNILLIGNKCDVDPSERKIPFEKGKELADEYGIKFCETSPKLNINVDNCFLEMTKCILERLKESEDCSRTTVYLREKQAKTRTSCY